MSTHVHIVGTGLIGTSIGLALTRRAYRVTLWDPSPTALGLAVDLGAGRPLSPDRAEPLGSADVPSPEPELVVVAAPPDVAGAVVARMLQRWPAAAVTDVASVKVAVLDAVRTAGADLSRYVGSHPMAGRERSGAVSARADLFDGRAWVVAPHESSRPAVVALVERMARDAGAAVRVMAPAEHDAAVAAVSHLPQVVASLVAGQLRELPAEAVEIAGQGLRDVTRIAASDPGLWTQILAGNAAAVETRLAALGEQLEAVRAALRSLQDGSGEGSLEVLARTISHGNAGHALIPGKHGAVPTAYRTVSVVVPDQPGNLARLLVDVGDIGVNLEDLRIDHGLGQPFGIAEIDVVPAAAERLGAELTQRGWRLHG